MCMHMYSFTMEQIPGGTQAKYVELAIIIFLEQTRKSNKTCVLDNYHFNSNIWNWRSSVREIFASPVYVVHAANNMRNENLLYPNFHPSLIKMVLF